MNDDEARKLATRIIDTWPSAAKGYVWRDTLVDLDPTHAATAYRRCARTAHRPPTPADFLDAYDAARLDAREDAHRTWTPPPQCQQCDGTGWVSVTPAQAHRPNLCRGEPGNAHGDGGCWCTAVTTCQCTTGAEMRDVHAHILERNERRT